MSSRHARDAQVVRGAREVPGAGVEGAEQGVALRPDHRLPQGAAGPADRAGGRLLQRCGLEEQVARGDERLGEVAAARRITFLSSRTFPGQA
jgi:hypothetical protein